MIYELFNVQARTAQMLIEAQTVFGLRMMGLSGLTTADPTENSRMVSEKHSAFADAGMAAAKALAAGKTPLQAYDMALKPIGRTTRANSARLMKSALS